MFSIWHEFVVFPLGCIWHWKDGLIIINIVDIENIIICIRNIIIVHTTVSANFGGVWQGCRPHASDT
jgi:hypothetical protein